jgi:Domain of unknown function (DUF5597)
LILGGELGNSSAGTAAQADSVLPRLARMHLQTVSLGGYLFEATLSRSWPAKTLLTDDGAMMILQPAPDQFYIVGSGLSVTFFRDPDVDNKLSGIAEIEEVNRVGGEWTTLRRLNGDQSNQGRQLFMTPHEIHVYRVNLYAVDRPPGEP